MDDAMEELDVHHLNSRRIISLEASGDGDSEVR